MYLLLIVYIYIYIYVCLYVCMCVHIYIYIYTCCGLRRTSSRVNWGRKPEPERPEMEPERPEMQPELHPPLHPNQFNTTIW